MTPKNCLRDSGRAQDYPRPARGLRQLLLKPLRTSHSLHEAVNLTFRIHQLLLAGIEWVALRTQIDTQRFRCGPGRNLIAATADDGCFLVICGMYTRLHCFILSQQSRPQFVQAQYFSLRFYGTHLFPLPGLPCQWPWEFSLRTPTDCAKSVKRAASGRATSSLAASNGSQRGACVYSIPHACHVVQLMSPEARIAV